MKKLSRTHTFIQQPTSFVFQTCIFQRQAEKLVQKIYSLSCDILSNRALQRHAVEADVDKEKVKCIIETLTQQNQHTLLKAITYKIKSLRYIILL